MIQFLKMIGFMFRLMLINIFARKKTEEYFEEIRVTKSIFNRALWTLTRVEKSSMMRVNVN